MLLVWAAATCLSANLALAATGAAGSEQRPIRVVTDDNYPPYIFRNADGKVEGYLVDLWNLWQSQTGKKVELIATSWVSAQAMVLDGEADVIDLIYRTPQREPRYDFSKPYAQLPVMIYSHLSISGIKNIDTLRGFQIGVQDGDACIDILKQRGVSEIRSYPNYELLINAALADDVKLFCMDEQPADFYLYRKNAQHTFTKAFELYVGEGHRAVRKGNLAILKQVEDGMLAISDADRDALADLIRRLRSVDPVQTLDSLLQELRLGRYPLLHGKAFQVTVGVGAAPGHSVALVAEAGSANTGAGHAGS